MIRFSDVDGAPKEISAPEKLNIIESANQMSDFEVDSFWKAEFANARDSMEMDPYERLLSESFNRSEDEINIDFGIDEKLLADLESFRAENWDAMDEIQRMADAYHMDIETIRKYFVADKERMMQDLAVQKAITFVTENAVEVEKKEETAE